MAEVALAWVTDRPGVTSTILGARTTGAAGDQPAGGRPDADRARRPRRWTEASDLHASDYPYGELGVDQRSRELSGR